MANSPSPSSFTTIWIPLLIILSLSTPCLSTTTISYENHCTSHLLQPNSTPTLAVATNTLQFSNGYFNSGNTLFHPHKTRIYSFTTHHFIQTHTPHVYKVEAHLVLEGKQTSQALPHINHELRGYYIVMNRRYFVADGIHFELTGFWSEVTGELCMIGHSTSSKHDNSHPLSVVLKASYPNTSNIFTSLVTAKLESLDAVGTANNFDSISLVAFAKRNYNYTMISKAKESCSNLKVEEESLPMDPDRLPLFGEVLKFDYYPLQFLFLSMIEHSNDRAMRLHIAFSHRNRFSFVPETDLVGEGAWDRSTNRLCAVGCRLSKDDTRGNVSVSDCSFRFCIWFPSVLTIKRPDTLVGRMWSTENQTDDTYLNTTVSLSVGQRRGRFSSDQTYRYTMLDTVRRSCIDTFSTPGNLTEMSYPASAKDMTMSLTLKDEQGNIGYGTAILKSIGETYYDGDRFLMGREEKKKADTGRIWNVSYSLSYQYPRDSAETEISAEGAYDLRTGKVCMIGCRRNSNIKECTILINLQLPQMNNTKKFRSNDLGLSGMICSSSNKSDAHYFEYSVQATKYRQFISSLSDKTTATDTGIIMVVFLSISVVSFAAQLFHVAKHRAALPSITVTVFLMLNLSVVVPLLQTFEAMIFRLKNLNYDPQQHDVWLETTKTIAELEILLLLLLHFCLVYVIAIARPATAEKKHQLMIANSRMVHLWMILYLLGGLICSFARSAFDSDSEWEDAISYSCLMIDGFILPQLILNMLWNAVDKAVTPLFYLGTTLLQAMPHFCNGYQLVRDKRMDMSVFYKYVIPCQGLFLASLMFLVGHLKSSAAKK